VTRDDQLAVRAAREVASGYVVGLGTGRAASRAIRAIAERVRTEGLDIRGVATSEASAALARELGIPLIPLDESGRVDVLLDGADEVAPDLSMLKGQGGAMTREKIVAWASTRRVYLVQRAKLVERLGERVGVPIEVLASSTGLVEATLRARGIEGAWRVADDGARALTDDGNPILDCPIPGGVDVRTMGALIDTTPGVVGHGLFLVEADAVFVEDASGDIEVRARGVSG
jgi:ribose 5-phosphate isomerase A